MLTALAHNYRAAGDAAKLAALIPFLAQLRHYLDQHGLDFVDGKATIGQPGAHEPAAGSEPDPA